MKAFSDLTSLLPHQHQKGVVSVSEQLEETVDYIKKLQEKVEKLKHKKKCLMEVVSENSTTPGLKTPNIINITVSGSALDVVLTTGRDYQFMFARVVRMLHEEGADVVNASFSVVNDTVFHTIHSEVNGERGPEHEAARICERLRKFVCDVA
ncbi:hypothetical protein Salat_2072500 [Sesamum alatum]|uniref:BHLH domain-containing protein n=1 Tax=Sesamum alatum TaxID=300844 RepID=A0AAE2CGJ0_9LAMI|nr:hypothetical protein Salat_2072500 [Sesamum alatum]